MSKDSENSFTKSALDKIEKLDEEIKFKISQSFALNKKVTFSITVDNQIVNRM